MFTFIKNHPFAVEAFFESSLVLTFGIPKVQLEHLIPACLTLDTLNETTGFIAIAMVQTKGLRPKGFPAFFGNDFFLIGYRVFVRYVTNSGKKLRGLYILKSQTDSKKMEFWGNIFTHYNYTTTDINNTEDNNKRIISSVQSEFSVTVETGSDKKPLPPDSPFTSWQEARKFAGPLPFTFKFDASTKKLLIIEGVRQNWMPLPVNVLAYKFSFLNLFPLKQVVLANAFVVNNIPYYWKKGKVEKWKG